jgi:ketosteroid isomerase-like protein
MKRQIFLLAAVFAMLAAYYTSDAVVVDEFAPYVWTGPTAATQWWAGVDKQMAQMGANTISAKGKPGHETSLFTLTLRRIGGTWKIATQTWATETATM